MIRRTSPHELARGALESAIAYGTVAHHSGAADDFYRAKVRRICELTGAARSTAPIDIELVKTADGRTRAIIDTAAGYWDSIIPAAVVSEIESR